MITRRSWLVYGALAAIWAALLCWQGLEHLRVRRAARDDLRHRATTISKTLALLMKQQRYLARRDRVEMALEGIVEQGDVISIALLNATNEERAAAGPPINARLKDDLIKQKEATGHGEIWDDQDQIVAFMNLANLGNSLVYTQDELPAPPPFRMGTNGPPDFPTNASTVAQTNSAATNFMAASDSNRAGFGPGFTNFGDAFRRGRIGGPPPLTAEQRESLGVHGFIMVMSANPVITTTNHDLLTRALIGILATVSVAGYCLAWGNLTKTSDLQIRLVRQSELNSHLKEMNLAAAGLAHETRNPLNIVRGLAQMISRREDASAEVKSRSREIIDETDRITAQLNEFINYSRPREVRRVSVNVNALAAEVVRALNYDLEEKKVQVRVLAEPLMIQADEQLLRQALFNLVINAIQAVSANGEIWIRAGKRSNSQAFLEVADNGHGVAPEHRTELFKPYFTTNEERGTGLGLAVVQQIVLAHGWEIACLPNQPTGAIFRITHIAVKA